VRKLLQVQTLRRREPVQVVLLHGLFSSSAFWIPYLERFAGFQLTLASVDYGVLLESGANFGELAAQIEAQFDDKPAHLVAHSFGCWLGMYLKRDFLSRSFICPTFAARTFDSAAFCSAIGRLTNGDIQSVRSLVERAVAYKQTGVSDLRYLPRDDFYLPEDDPFFCYVGRVEAGTKHSYRGGHFDLSSPTDLIGARLSAAQRPAHSG
jgi:pimeloyl-ACP methyl ester carboxylesterase